MKALHRDSASWRLKNTCPACSYKLHGEKKLAFEMLITMDGNNSLKWLRRDVIKHQVAGENLTRECPDPRSAPGDYYLTWEEVDGWAKAVVEDELIRTTPVSTVFVTAVNFPGWCALQQQDDVGRTSCTSRWSNMIDHHTSRMWGIFDEMGIFLSLCRHGFVLLVADMIHSGEK